MNTRAFTGPRIGVALLFVLALVCFACKDTRSGSRYRFSFGHISPDTGAVDVYIDGNLFFEGLPPGDVTGYIVLANRPRSIAYTLAGEEEAIAGPREPEPIQGGGRQTVLLIGTEADNTRTLLAWNQRQGEPDNDRLRVLITHGGIDVDRVELVLDGRVESRSIRFLDAADGNNRPAELTRLKIRREEEGLKLTGQTAYPLPGGGDYSVILDGTLADDTIRMLVLRDVDGMFFEPASQIRPFHGLAGIEEVDFLANGELLLDRSKFADREEYIPILPGTYRITANLPDTDTEVADLGEVTLAPGGDATVFAHLPPSGMGDGEGTSVADTDEIAVDDTARLRFANLVADVESGIILLLEGEAIFGTVGYTGVTDYLRVENGTQEFIILDAATGEELLPAENFRLRQGEDFTITAVGLASGEPEIELVRLEDDLDRR